MDQAHIILTNGLCFSGEVYNLGTNIVQGEIVFTTGMVGYEESLTDPSYKGQIVLFTYPLLGNYGVGDSSNWESKQIQVQAVICENIITSPEHYAQQQTFLSWLKANNVVLITGVDTRELTKVLRHNGSSACIISRDRQVEFGHDTTKQVVSQVSTRKIVQHGNGKYKIILVDCGAKQNIIRNLLKFDVTVIQVPYDYDYSQEEYDGILLSNGPGDPKECVETINVLKKVMLNNKPIFGICLGAQIMGLCAGADTYKLKFGHRGHNQPCIDLETKRCYLTSQNHGYALRQDSLSDEWQVTFSNLNDNTVAGIRHKTKPFTAVQFHPEAAGGPEDTQYLFNQFFTLVQEKAR